MDIPLVRLSRRNVLIFYKEISFAKKLKKLCIMYKHKKMIYVDIPHREVEILDLMCGSQMQKDCK